jgi:hypothetical protein
MLLKPVVFHAEAIAVDAECAGALLLPELLVFVFVVVEEEDTVACTDCR